MQGVESLPDTEDWLRLWLDKKGGFCEDTRGGCMDLSPAGAKACDWAGCG